MLIIPMPSRRQNQHPNPREWESSQCHRKWNKGTVNPNKPFLPYAALLGYFAMATVTGMELTWNTRQGTTEPNRTDGNHGALFTFSWVHGNIRKSWLLQYRLKYKWVLQREMGVGGNKEEHSWRETGGGCENRVSETSSLTKAENTGSWGDTKYLEFSSVCLLHNWRDQAAGLLCWFLSLQ